MIMLWKRYLRIQTCLFWVATSISNFRWWGVTWSDLVVQMLFPMPMQRSRRADRVCAVEPWTFLRWSYLQQTALKNQESRNPINGVKCYHVSNMFLITILIQIPFLTSIAWHSFLYVKIIWHLIYHLFNWWNHLPIFFSNPFFFRPCWQLVQLGSRRRLERHLLPLPSQRRRKRRRWPGMPVGCPLDGHAVEDWKIWRFFVGDGSRSPTWKLGKDGFMKAI